MNQMSSSEFLGCGDNSCVFGRPLVGTNGGCRCFKDIEDRTTQRRVRQAAVRQRQEIITLEATITTLKDEYTKVSQDHGRQIGRVEELKAEVRTLKAQLAAAEEKNEHDESCISRCKEFPNTNADGKCVTWHSCWCGINQEN